MNKEVMSFYNLTAHPFTKEIPAEELLELDSVNRAFKSLSLLVETRGIGVMTGKPGTGKSCLIRKLKSSLHSGLYKPLYICHTSVSATEMYAHICHELGLIPVGRRSTMFRAIQEKIHTMNTASRIHPVLIIDEAHLLRNDILADLRLLTNFEIDSRNALTVLLCGQDGLEQRLGLSILEALTSAITMNIRLCGLSREETFAYLEQRLSVAGNREPLFTKNALELIHQHSAGVMRTINIIATAALMHAYQTKAQTVEKEHVSSVISR